MTQPTRMPRTTLEFISGVDTPLAPGRGEHYYSTPNPMRDSSGSFQAVSAAGPPPYSQDVPLRVFILVAAGLFGVVFAVIALMMPFGSARGADSTGDSLHFMNAFFFIGGIAFVMAVGFLINSTLSRRRRIATAWKNDWIDYYPALVGQIYHTRRVLRKGNNLGKTFLYYYRAPLQVLYPDGSFRQMQSFELEMKARPDWYRTRCNMASSAQTAVANGWNNNGWAIVGISRFPGQTHAELDPGLTHQQCEAIFNLAERNWLRTAW